MNGTGGTNGADRIAIRCDPQSKTFNTLITQKCGWHFA